MAGKSTKLEDTSVAKPARKKREPKPVTDLTSASVAYKRALRIAEKADAELIKARDNAHEAGKALAVAKEQMGHYYQQTLDGGTPTREVPEYDAESYSS